MNLLYPNGKENVKRISEDTYQHLCLDELVNAIATKDEDVNLVRETFMNIPLDADTVSYRQEILQDFLANPDFCRELKEIVGYLNILRQYNEHNFFAKSEKASIYDLISYMQEMSVYIRIVDDLGEFFARHPVTSRALKEVSHLVSDVVDRDKIDELKELIASLQADISTLQSITVGINLTPELNPEELQVLSFNNTKFKSKFYNKTNMGASLASGYQVRFNEPSQLMNYLSKEVEHELAKMVRRDKKNLREYVNLEGYFLLDICRDLRFYLLMAEFAGKLKKRGFTLCFPKIKEDADSVTLKGIYNLRLCKEDADAIVKNDFTFTEKEKLFVLTGPNRGGKTMLTQGIGIAALFAAEGYFVSADSYEGYLFADVLTHFPVEEDQTLNLGRLGEEAVRMKEIVKEASPRTLVLLNETYSSTCASDGLYLAEDLIHVLKHKNVPLIFNTHIHELARCVDEMNEWEGGSEVVSITMEIVNNVNTFRVLRSAPDVHSYARNIALKYGITYEQMLEGE